MFAYNIGETAPNSQSRVAQASIAPVNPGKNYLVGLNALRAIAALSVCLFHYTNGMLPKLVVPYTKAAFENGYLGVDIFFVISGFIIPYSLIGKNYRVSKIGNYLKKRILRINPPAYVSVFLILAQWFLIDYFINHSTHYTDSLSWGQLLANLTFIVPFTNYQWINGIFWTLAIEFQFYLFIGLLFARLFEHAIPWFVGIYLLIATAALLPHAASIWFLAYSSLFALGGLALLWQQRRLSPLAYGLGLLMFGAIAFWQLSFYAALVGVGTALAINAITFSIPGLTFLGKLSYSLYLVHGLIGTTAEFVIIKLLPPTSDARKLLLTAICLSLAIAGAYLFYRFVEQPFMRLAGQKRG
jgi:peptidoglycan/LPS O-acetylase OafA/YrhL